MAVATPSSTPVPHRRRITRRQRRRLVRVAQYGVLVAVVLVLAVAVDWGTIQQKFFDPIYVFGGEKVNARGRTVVYRSLWPDIITTALFNTLRYAVCAFVFGLVLGTLLALMKLSQVRVYRWVANLYIEFFRACRRCWCSSSSASASSTRSPGSASPTC